jgi:hypothetical protein
MTAQGSTCFWDSCLFAVLTTWFPNSMFPALLRSLGSFFFGWDRVGDRTGNRTGDWSSDWVGDRVGDRSGDRTGNRLMSFHGNWIWHVP